MFQTSDNKKRIAKNTLLLYFRMLVTMLMGLYTSRLVLAVLGVEDYGLYNVVGGIVVILSFLNGAMASSTQRYLNVELGKHDKEGLKKVYATSLLIHGGVAIMILILAETIGLWFLNSYMNIVPERMCAANWVYQFSVATFVVSVLSVPYNASIIAHERMSAFAYISVVEAILKLMVALLISHSPIDKLVSYALLMFVMGVILRIVYSIYCHRHFEECRVVSFKIDKPLFKSMISFSSWTIIGNLSYIFHTQGIAIVINMFFGAAVNAAQGISNQVNGIVSGFVQNFMTAMKPQVVKNHACGNMEEMHKLILVGSRVSFFLVLLFSIPIILEAPYLLSLWLKEVPEYTVIFIRILLLVTLCDSFNSLLNAAQGATGMIRKYMIVMTCVSIMHLPLSWIFFTLGFEPYYAMVVYLSLVIIMQVLRIWFVCRAVNLSIRIFYSEVVTRCIAVFILAFVPPFCLHKLLENGCQSTLCVCFVSVIFSLFFILLLGLKRQERVAICRFAINKINNVRLKL